MKLHLASLLFACLGLGACAHAAPAAVADPAPAAKAPSLDPSPALDSQRQIVLAVANPMAAPSRHAGSNLLGYASARYYGAGTQAVATLDALNKRYGLRQVAGWPIKALGLYCVVLEPAPGSDRAALLAQLAKDDRVALSQPLQDFGTYSADSQAAAAAPAQPLRYNDPYVDMQRGFAATNAATAQTLSQGQGVDVAIVDTGVDTSHPDLRGRLRNTRDLVAADPGAFNRDHHGTEVAGIIAAGSNNHLGIVGIAPKAMLDVYKACWYPQRPGAGAGCNSFTLAKALAAIGDTRTRIINLSLGGPADPLLRKLMEQLLRDGRIVVAAMPPNGRMDGFPDGIPGVIVVRSSAATPAPAGVLSAPGEDILTTQPNGGYDFTSGSSMATAHVSGVVALLLALAPQLDARSVHDLLLRTSRTRDGLLQVDAAAAVQALPRSAPLAR
ncbi:S8 family serine peptidase [Xanthomonas rydalmerensis]|uniref:S8 family serine peptidase n=1 Tax=Xanthomonas rydalmerensis TaxID=3046274 RepID=A0ABZ0JSK1_9XANT|nr:S8 family serine peptidase [Xanthomonas sp. DM-2023]WOS42822.1 S8 family serine peptidase [Xanthomonas sp. DM-2023]WOS47009.1 S8 family serine peptidase [Xanthomonas sp. DM-2023]WOS51188.1 S8 family serine peptidase [Xanthomonas sp. DM-2023]WOS55369.1 S8 family serine peptidase [Xanthomonas sp. DM-2023]WOS59551.1 S8 family serine peptidase [Xanthomonas sp. DM-2023]